jgi:dTDP-4-amino-4,6-dideoxygalactose transaminase
VLRRIDYAKVRNQRRHNFAMYHSHLAHYNELRLEVRDDQVPMCYPFLPVRTIDRQILHSKGLFVGQYWQDCLNPSRPPNFEWERRLSSELLALPSDQRYSDKDITRVIETILSLL